MDPEVYVIDYRGPETHTYMPPPNRSGGGGGGGRPHIHHRNFVLRRKSKAKVRKLLYITRRFTASVKEKLIKNTPLFMIFFFLAG